MSKIRSHIRALRDRLRRGHPPHLSDALELASILRPSWPAMSAELRSSGVPIAEGDDDDEDKDKEKDKDKVTLSKKEHDGLKRGIAEKDRELRETKSRVEELEQKVEDLGSDDDAVAKLEKRIERAEEARKAAERERDEARQEKESSAKQRAALAVATRMRFKNPEQAIRILDSEDLETEAETERALERLAREEPYLRNRSQRPVDDPDEKEKKRPGSNGDKAEGEDDEELTGEARMRAYYEKQEAEKKKASAASSEDAD